MINLSYRVCSSAHGHRFLRDSLLPGQAGKKIRGIQYLDLPGRVFSGKNPTGLRKEFDDPSIPKFKRKIIDLEIFDQLASQFEDSGLA